MIEIVDAASATTVFEGGGAIQIVFD